MSDHDTRQRAYLECPCCSEDAVPNTHWATEDDVTEDVDVGDPLWWEDSGTPCPRCGCTVAVRVDEIAYTSLVCEGVDEVWKHCPCSNCRKAWREQNGPR